MKTKRAMAIGVMLFGMGLSFGATLLPRLLPRDTFWDASQAEEQTTASTRLHQETFEAAEVQRSAKSTVEEKQHAAQELAAAQARFEASRDALERAQFWRNTVPVAMRWIGGFIALIGVGGLLSLQSP